MDQLLSLAELVAKRLIERGETVAVAESSAGGMISTALLAIPGASAYFIGGVNLYTPSARAALLDIDPTLRSATVPYAQLIAHAVRRKLVATWGIGESGVTGPTANRYGDPVGHGVVALVGPNPRNAIINARHEDRVANMRAFAQTALKLFADQLQEPE